MLQLRGLRHRRNLSEQNTLLDRFSGLIFVALLGVAAVEKLLVIAKTDGGADLLYADIPKSLMLLMGQNPYSIQPWASPYPPFFLMVVGGIIQVTGGPGVSSEPLALISRNIMLAAMLADLIVGVMIFSVLKRRGFSGLQALVPTGIFLILPAISTSPYFFFHSDLFGYPILAGSLLAFVSNRFFTGSTLLAVSTIFKLHPLLAIALVLVWMVRRNGLVRTLPSLASCVSILSLGLVLPLWVSGYANAVLGFNLSNVNGTVSFSLMNLFYGVLPAAFGVTLSLSTINELWITLTTALFILVLGQVWNNAEGFDPVDVVLLGLLVWLLPLRQIYTHYVVWAVIPFLMKGRLVSSLVAGAVLELANTMAVWSWNIQPDPFPVMNSVYGFFLTSLVYSMFSVLAIYLVLRGGRSGGSVGRCGGVGGTGPWSGSMVLERMEPRY